MELSCVLWNAPYPIVVTELPSVMLVKNGLEKESRPMPVTLLG